MLIHVGDHSGYGLSQWEEALLCNASLIDWAHTQIGPACDYVTVYSSGLHWHGAKLWQYSSAVGGIMKHRGKLETLKIGPYYA